MSFADELRSFNKGEENNNVNLNRDVQLFINLLKKACREANSSNRRSVSIYCIMWQDDGYTETGFIEQLPTVKQVAEESKLFNKARHTNYSRFNNVSTGNYEQRLYSQLVAFEPKRLDYAKRLRQLLNNELSKLGFSTYKANLIELDDIYIIHNRKANMFTGTVSESLSTRAAGKLYTINLQATW